MKSKNVLIHRDDLMDYLIRLDLWPVPKDILLRQWWSDIDDGSDSPYSADEWDKLFFERAEALNEGHFEKFLKH